MMGQLTRNEVFTLAVQKYSDAVYRAAMHNSRCAADAEDVVMQLFEELIVKARRHEIRNFRSWLHTVCRNLCLMRLPEPQRHSRHGVDTGVSYVASRQQPFC